MGDEEAAIRVCPATRRAWDYYSLDHIWAMLRDEDGVDNYRQAAAWYRMANLCTDQADQLEKALAQLMARWPPNPGSAAQSFKIWVEEFILSLRDSAAAAQANEGPLITITRLLSQAKDQVGQLVQQHVESDRAERDWAAAASNAFGVVPPSPVEPGWREALEGKARDIMFATDAAIGEAASQFRAPTPFVQVSIGDPSVPVDPDPVLRQRPPLVPSPKFVSASPPVAGTTTHDDLGVDSDADGAILAGAPLPFPGQLDQGSVSPFVDTPVGRVLAPGGIIAATVGPVAIGNPADRDGTGPGGSAGASDMRSASAVPGMMAPPLGRPGPGSPERGGAVRSAGRRRRRSDPEDPWLPRAGGPSVLEPAPEPDWFDPGPNVIGIDR
jgi:hypothetical protein